MSNPKSLEVGKKIKLLLVEHNINQNQVARYLNVSDSLFSDKLNGKVKITVDEFYDIITYLNEEFNITVCHKHQTKHQTLTNIKFNEVLKWKKTKAITQ